MGAAGFSVHHLLSGALPEPLPFCQDDDELAVVLEGSALLEVQGQTLALCQGDWVWLPAGTEHRLMSTQHGTRWLTVHHSAAALAAGAREGPG